MALDRDFQPIVNDDELVAARQLDGLFGLLWLLLTMRAVWKRQWSGLASMLAASLFVGSSYRIAFYLRERGDGPPITGGELRQRARRSRLMDVPRPIA